MAEKLKVERLKPGKNVHPRVEQHIRQVMNMVKGVGSKDLRILLGISATGMHELAEENKKLLERIELLEKKLAAVQNICAS